MKWANKYKKRRSAASTVSMRNHYNEWSETSNLHITATPPFSNTRTCSPSGKQTALPSPDLKTFHRHIITVGGRGIRGTRRRCLPRGC